MKKFLIIAALIVSSIYAQKDTCYTGIYINSLTDFNISEQSFTADFWMWFNYKNDSLRFNDAIEITNAKTVSFSNYAQLKKGEYNWAMLKVNAVVFKEWDVTNFPFDKQKLTMHIDHTIYDESKLVFVTDKGNSTIDSNIVLSGWKFKSLSFYTKNQTYNTTFGDPEIKGSSTYPSVTADIYINREYSWNTLIKMLTGVYVAFSIVLLAFFVKPSDRLGLCVGGLFATVGNKYIVETVVPSTISNTLFDNIHNVTFISIFIVLVLAVIAFKWSELEDKVMLSKAKILDKRGFWIVSTVYALVNFSFIFMASRGV